MLFEISNKLLKDMQTNSTTRSLAKDDPMSLVDLDPDYKDLCEILGDDNFCKLVNKYQDSLK